MNIGDTEKRAVTAWIIQGINGDAVNFAETFGKYLCDIYHFCVAFWET